MVLAISLSTDFEIGSIFLYLTILGVVAWRVVLIVKKRIKFNVLLLSIGLLSFGAYWYSYFVIYDAFEKFRYETPVYGWMSPKDTEYHGNLNLFTNKVFFSPQYGFLDKWNVIGTYAITGDTLLLNIYWDQHNDICDKYQIDTTKQGSKASPLCSCDKIHQPLTFYKK